MAKKEGKLKVYNVRWHKFYFRFIYALVLILCVIVFPFILTFIANAFSGRLSETLKDVPTSYERWIIFWSNWIPCTQRTIDPTTEVISDSLLPDFLGGMAGIVVGLWLDSVILEKIRTIKKYESMILPLKNEFQKWIKDYDELKVEIAIQNYETLFRQVWGYGQGSTKFYEKIKILRQDIMFDNQDQEEACKAIYGTITSQDSKWEALSIIQQDNLDQDKTKGINNAIKYITEKITKGDGSEKKEWSQNDIDLLLQTINTLCCDCILPEEITPSVLDDIVTDYENFSIVSNLPHRCPNFILRIFGLPYHRPFLAEKLQELIDAIDQFNSWSKESAQNERLIYFHLKEFETIIRTINSRDKHHLGIWKAMQMDLEGYGRKTNEIQGGKEK